MTNTKNVFISLLMAMMSSGIMFGQQDSVNLALEATVTTSHVSPWETLGAVNDGIEPTSSDKTGTAYGNWNGEGDYGIYNWVQYDWTNAVYVTSTAVYWWDDNPGDVGIAQPTEAYIEYWNGVEWVNAGDIGTALDTYNVLYIGGVWTQKIRITMKSPAATGILEWKVYGHTGGDCEPTPFGVTINVNGSDLGESNFVSILVGDDLILTADQQPVGQYYWSGPNGFSATGNVVSFENMQANESGTYSVIFINECGAVSKSAIPVTVKITADGSAYSWPAYDPPIYYDFRDEFPVLEMPTKDLEDCANVAGRQSSGWWTFVWGPNARSVVTEAAITPMLERFNRDFAYFRDTLGWPPDKRAKRGYRSAIYLYGSGLCTDNEDSTALGGWQGSIYFQGENWPMVLASYYPVYSFDPACPYGDRQNQMGAMIHEGIHSLLADLPGARNSAWFHEGGNTWLQQEMESQKSGDYSSMGFLNAGALIAPFMPIECYSGWLQDESFGGPSAEGVNMFNNGQQICTWKNLLGGNQYGNIFPVIFSQIFGDHSVAWIWRYCENRVLEGIADTLGDYQTRRLIMEYRAKQALLDIGKWTGACRKLIDNNFGVSIHAEWQPSWLNSPAWYATPYVITSVDETGLLIPEYRTTPGWSGANQIPLIVDADTVTVEFLPIGENMSCQLCYRAEDGSMVYGEPVLGGECKLIMDKKAANDVVFAVICNTDYIYEGEQTRKAHFDYQLKLGYGVKERANWNTRWYRWDSNLSNTAVPVTTVDFSASPTSMPAGSIVHFIDKSKNIVRGWLWDFGDGTTSTEQNPDHTYSTTGTYTVSLTVLGTNGAVTTTKSDYIYVGPTGIFDIKKDNSLVLFPNPARERCTVIWPDGILRDTDLKIFNANGKELVLKTSINEKSFEIDLSDFSSGLYYISVITDNIPVTEKLIILK